MPHLAETASADIPAALAQFDKLPNSSYVRLPVVAALFSVSEPTVWRWTKKGRLVAHKIGPNTTAWNVGELRNARTMKEAA
jgi:predicted DNA-binding transcriptional regulator AlpA